MFAAQLIKKSLKLELKPGNSKKEPDPPGSTKSVL
jgi:hypothetical protein